MSSPDPVKYQLWYYTPSQAAAILMAAVFGILTIVHAFLLFKKRTWFCIPLVIGGLFEVIGYAARAVCHNDLQATTPYAIQSVLILLAPILFAASVYMYLGRIVTAVHGQEHSVVRPRWLTRIFVCGDILCFFVQGGGGGMLVKADTQSKVNLGEHIILGGLILQILIFGLFIMVAAVFHVRMRKQSTLESRQFPWQRLLAGLYAVSVLITVRNVIRVIEYGIGSGGYFLQNEWTTYVFDAAAMALVLLICLFWYFSGVTSRKTEENDVELVLESGAATKTY